MRYGEKSSYSLDVTQSVGTLNEVVLGKSRDLLYSKGTTLVTKLYNYY